MEWLKEQVVEVHLRNAISHGNGGQPFVGEVIDIGADGIRLEVLDHKIHGGSDRCNTQLEPGTVITITFMSLSNGGYIKELHARDK